MQNKIFIFSLLFALAFSACVPEYEYDDAGTCKACAKKLTDCKKCSADGATCTECYSDIGVDLITNACVSCQWECTECDGASTTCQDCIGQKSKGAYYWEDTTEQACKACTAITNCKRCKDATLCKDCNSGYGEVSGACIQCEDTNCENCDDAAATCQYCKSGYTIVLNVCTQGTALNCQSYKTGDPAKCYYCKTGYTLDTTELCVDCATAIPNCKECSQSSKMCEECKDKYKSESSDTVCTACSSTVACECETHYEWNGTSEACVKKTSDCTAEQATSGAIFCLSGMIYECKSGYEQNSSSSLCVEQKVTNCYMTDALTGGSLNACKMCKSSYYIDGKRDCVANSIAGCAEQKRKRGTSYCDDCGSYDESEDRLTCVGAGGDGSDGGDNGNRLAFALLALLAYFLAF